MEFARTSGLWGCKRLRSSESRRPRLREVVGQRPKAARHPVGEPENGRPQPGANASFVIFRQCVDPGEIYIYHHLPISLSTSLPTQLPTYLSTHRSIYLFPPVELVVPGLARDLLAVPDHVALPRAQAIPLVPKGLRLEGKAFHRELWFALGLLWAFPPRWSESRVPTRDTQGDPLAATPFAGVLPQWGWPPAQWTPTARCVPELDRWRTVGHPAPRAENQYILIFSLMGVGFYSFKIVSIYCRSSCASPLRALARPAFQSL